MTDIPDRFMEDAPFIVKTERDGSSEISANIANFNLDMDALTEEERADFAFGLAHRSQMTVTEGANYLVMPGYMREEFAAASNEDRLHMMATHAASPMAMSSAGNEVEKWMDEDYGKKLAQRVGMPSESLIEPEMMANAAKVLKREGVDNDGVACEPSAIEPEMMSDAAKTFSESGDLLDNASGPSLSTLGARLRERAASHKVSSSLKIKPK